ncbi:MAG: apolipoprotein N-acyltransferase [Proteobacteria bacterium]|nr:apolipoprotein N-acyltransferase [Pseudomonadota bacterium]
MIYNRKLGDVLALISGSILPLAFAPYSIFPIAILSLVILFLLWQNVTPKRAGWRGFLFGIGMFGVGVSWVHISFYQFGGLPMVGAILLTLVFVLVVAIYPALLGWSLIRFFPKYNLLLLPAAWTLMEWLRGWLFTGFPWLSVGYSQIDSPLNNIAPIFGVYGVSFFTVLIAVIFIYSFHHKILTKLSIKPIRISILISIIGVILAVLGFINNIEWTKPIDKPIKVALMQGNVPQEFKWLSGFQLPSMQRYLELSQSHRDADLIIWPETAIPLFYHEIPSYAPGFLEELMREKLEHKTDFLIGIPIIKSDGTYYNTVMSFTNKPEFYYKNHLVPFGEYIPLQVISGNLFKLLNIPMSEFSAGAAKQTPLTSVNHLIGVSICYEDAFGDLIRNSLPAAELLVNVSNDAWFGNSIAPHQHLEIARMRSLETGRYLLRATNTGISAVIDNKGKVIAQSPQFQITALRAEVQPYQGITPYVRFGDKLIVIISLLILGLFYFFQNQTKV